jgi:ABC-type glycerol-3-phosphate transport system substrate-binding protein
VDESVKVDVSDALMVLQYSVGKRSVLPLADVMKYKDDPQEIKVSSLWANRYQTTDEDGVVLQQSIQRLEERGIHTTLSSLDATEVADTIVNEYRAGKASADVYEVTLDMCRDIARQGAAANIFESSTLAKGQWFNNNPTAACRFGDKTYGVSPYPIGTAVGVFYNKDLLKQYCDEYDLYELFVKDEWTMDKFTQLITQCTVDINEDGKTDIYGFASDHKMVDYVINAHTGGFTKLEEGKVVPIFHNEDGSTAVKWCRDAYKELKAWMYRADQDDALQNFKKQEAAMLVMSMDYLVSNVSSLDFDAGFVCMPRGADQTKMSSNVHYESKVYVVPEIQKHRLDEIGYWLNGIAMANQGLFENRHNVMLEIGLDENSWQSYLWLANAQPDYSSGLSSTVRTEISSLATTTVPSPSHSWPKRLEQAAKVAEKELDKYYKPFYK